MIALPLPKASGALWSISSKRLASLSASASSAFLVSAIRLATSWILLMLLSSFTSFLARSPSISALAMMRADLMRAVQPAMTSVKSGLDPVKRGSAFLRKLSVGGIDEPMAIGNLVEILPGRGLMRIGLGARRRIVRAVHRVLQHVGEMIAARRLVGLVRLKMIDRHRD